MRSSATGFRHAAPTHVPHLAMWLTEVFGGPKLYSETLGDIAPILARHAGGDFSDDDRQRFVELARQAAEEHIPSPQPRALDAFHALHRVGRARGGRELAARSRVEPGRRRPDVELGHAGLSAGSACRCVGPSPRCSAWSGVMRARAA